MTLARESPLGSMMNRGGLRSEWGVKEWKQGVWKNRGEDESFSDFVKGSSRKEMVDKTGEKE